MLAYKPPQTRADRDSFFAPAALEVFDVFDQIGNGDIQRRVLDLSKRFLARRMASRARNLVAAWLLLSNAPPQTAATLLGLSVSRVRYLARREVAQLAGEQWMWFVDRCCGGTPARRNMTAAEIETYEWLRNDLSFGALYLIGDEVRTGDTLRNWDLYRNAFALIEATAETAI